MALGTALAAIGTAAASGLASSAASSLLGGGSGGGSADELSKNFRGNNPTINSSGININAFKNNSKDFGFDIGLGAGLTGALDQFRSLSGNTVGQLGRQQARLAPGFSDLRKAGLAQLDNSRTRTIGDLRDDLARRRVLGSSFANDTITRAESEFGQQRAQFEAQTLMQEIDATVNLINQQSQISLTAISQDIAAQASLADIGASLVTGVQSNLTALAQTNAQIAAANASANAQGIGAFIQPAVDAFGSAVGNGLESFFAPPKKGKD